MYLLGSWSNPYTVQSHNLDVLHDPPHSDPPENYRLLESGLDLNVSADSFHQRSPLPLTRQRPVDQTHLSSEILLKGAQQILVTHPDDLLVHCLTLSTEATGKSLNSAPRWAL